MTPDPEPPQPNTTPGPASPLGRLDAWMAANPWHPRAAAFFVYMIGILLISLATDGAFGLPELTAIKPVLYVMQVGLVVFLLWRYRGLLPELNLKFHWLAIPTGVGLVFAWVYLGYASIGLSRAVQDIPVLGDIASFLVDPGLPVTTVEVQALHDEGKTPPSWFLEGREQYGEAWYWTAMIARLIGMSLVVPLFEELWVRSAVLRGMFSPARTKTAVLQLASDLPIIGETISRTQAAQRATQQPAMITQQLIETRVGQISTFSVIASTVVFMLAHQRRDYLGCIACGLVWCLLVWWTNKPRKGETWDDQPPGGRTGLGPIAWSHGITNACLWYWTIHTGDWQFL